MHVLVTGGAGFIGSHLIEALLHAGYRVRVVDNFSTGKRKNLDAFRSDVEILEGDLRSYESALRAVQNVEIVLHQAALPSVPRSIVDPLTTNAANVTGTLNILEASRRSGVRRVVYASSSSVYGDGPELPKHELMTPNPRSPYAVSKLSAERYCRVFAELYGLETIALRYFNVFGPRQDPDSPYAAVIPKFINAMLCGEQPVVFGDGEQSRDFTFIANVVRANILAATASFENGLAMNVACHERTTLNQLVAMINGILGTAIIPRYERGRPGDVRHSLADVTLVRRQLGYEPRTGLELGLRRTVEFYRSQAAIELAAHRQTA